MVNLLAKLTDEQLIQLSHRFWERAEDLMGAKRNGWDACRYGWDWPTFRTLYPRHVKYYYELFDEGVRRGLVKPREKTRNGLGATLPT